MNQELAFYVLEAKKYQQRSERLRRQREENLKMSEDEKIKMIFDVQQSKNKIDSLKLDVYNKKKRLQELEKFEQLYCNYKVKDEEREMREIDERIKTELKH